MTIFQAYCFDVNHDYDTFVLTFPDPYVADEWWRAISDTPTIASLFTRVNPQFYTYTGTSLDISDFFTDSQTQSIASKFQRQLFITRVDDQPPRLPIVQSVKVASVVHGQWYYIRSVTTPHVYWYYDIKSDPTSLGQRLLTVSETAYTRFRVVAVDDNVHNKVLLNEDLVQFKVWTEKEELYVNHAGSQSGVGRACASNDIQYRYRLDFMRNNFILRGDDRTLVIWNYGSVPSRNWELVE